MIEPSIYKNLEKIHQRINAACNKSNRDPKEITLIAVSKTKPNEAILDAFSASQLHFGENRMQELQEKMEAISEPTIEWHMIGTMQSNKIKYIANRVNWIHSASKSKHLNEIQKRAELANRTINVLIQVNISGEDQKSGCDPSELESMLTHAKTLPNLMIQGLMGMATFSDNPEDIRPEFAKLKTTLTDHSHLNGENVQLKELSMGMSGDFEVAIEEGATMIRVGSAIFGSRN
ncbi:MAG: YggS family pyridoxal phosphate-dependent enzyme [Balneola sp.]|nr:MAG: YggS family pyridoxal phosphate-dependent enzyme [Balneola sp.]